MISLLGLLIRVRFGSESVCIYPKIYKVEQFLIECRKTKTKVITLANHKGRRAIHCPIKSRSNYTRRGKTSASKSRLVLALLLIG